MNMIQWSKIFFLISVGTLFSNETIAQCIDNPIEQLSELYSDLQEKLNVVNSGSIHVVYEMVVMNINNDINSMHCELYANKHRSYFKSDDYDVYQDSSCTVGVLHRREHISILDNYPVEDKARMVETVMSFDKELFAKVTVESCVKAVGSTGHFLVLKCSEELRSRTEIDSYEFHVDFSEKVLKHIKMNFNKELRKTVYAKCNIITMESGGNYKELMSDPKSKVINTDGSIIQTYASYQIEDLTKVKHY